MVSKQRNGITNNIYFQLVVFMLLALSGWIIPAGNGLTPEGIKLLGILFAVIYGWTATSEVWPSFLAFVLILMTGLTDFKGLMAVSWGNDMLYFMVLIFVMIAFLEKTGTSSFVAAWLMSRKFLNGHPWRFLFMLLFVSWILCTFVEIFPGVFITWGIIYKVLDILNYKPYEKFSTIVLFGVVAMGALSLSALPWKGNALVILNSISESQNINIDMLHYLTYSIPFDLLAIISYLCLCRWVFKLDVSRLKNLKIDFFSEEDLALTPERKISLFAIALMIFLLLIPSIFPSSWAFTQFFSSIGLTPKLIMVFIFLAFIKINGEHIFKFGELAVKGVNWNMVIMTVSILAFVGLMAKPETGISIFLSNLLTPIFADISIVWFFVISVAITVILTNFTINMVVAMIMITVTLPVGANLGIPPEQIIYLLTVCCTIAFCLPSASPSAMLLFANKTWIKAKDAYKYAIPTLIVFTIIATLVNVIRFMF